MTNTNSPPINKEQFDLIYHMLLDALVRVTAIENLLMRKNMTTDQEIQDEIVAISASVINGVSEALSTTFEATEALTLEDIPAILPVAAKKKDYSSN